MKPKTFQKLVMLTGLAAVLAASGCTSGTGVTGEIVSHEPATPGSGAGSGEIRIPLSEITSQAGFYSFNAGGTEVNFFAVRGSDGQVRTAFDACDVCGGYKGYRQEGSDMVCNNCGRHFRIDSIGTENMGGGCWPTHLSHVIDGNYVIIKESELSEGRFRF